MDFFERQDYSPRQTVRLLVMFALAVVAIILAIYLVAAIFTSHAQAERSSIRRCPRSGIHCSWLGSPWERSS